MKTNNIYKHISIFCVILIVLSLSSCNNKKTNDNIVSSSLKEGFYISNNFAFELIFVGSNTDLSYNIAFYNVDNGLNYYRGTVYNCSNECNTLTFIDYDRFDSTLIVKFDDTSSSVSCLNLSSEHNLLCGEYKWYGENWQSTNERRKGTIIPGEYHFTGYTLNITKENEITHFIVVDNFDRSIAFEGSSSADIYDSVSLPYNNNKIEFKASFSENINYVTIIDSDQESPSPFTGKYSLLSYEYFVNGTYECNGYSIKVSKKRDRDNLTELSYLLQFSIYNDSNELLWEQTETLSPETQINHLKYFDENSSLEIFKGENTSENYIDILNTNMINNLPTGRYIITD